MGSPTASITDVILSALDPAALQKSRSWACTAEPMRSLGRSTAPNTVHTK
jgi:hypothetical protein